MISGISISCKAPLDGFNSSTVGNNLHALDQLVLTRSSPTRPTTLAEAWAACM